MVEHPHSAGKPLGRQQFVALPLQNVPFSTAPACKEGFFGVQGSSSMSTHHALQHSAAAKAQLLRQHLQRAVDHAQMVAKAQGAFKATGVGTRDA